MIRGRKWGTYGSLNIVERLASGERRRREVDFGGHGDDLRAVDERARVLGYNREFGHHRLKLLHHGVVVGCMRT